MFLKISNPCRIHNVFRKSNNVVRLLLRPSAIEYQTVSSNLYTSEQCGKQCLSALRGVGSLSPYHAPLTSPFRNYCLPYSSSAGREDVPQNEEKKLTLLQRFKQMYRDYWYVLVPVHVATSIVWYGGFYYIAKSGVDVAALLKNIGFAESIVSPLRDSSAGYLAVAYAMYKIATPARYTVTLGGTTISIKYLKQWGYIKPIPPKEKLKEMYAEKMDSYRERKDQMVESYREKKESVRTGLQGAKESLTQGLRKGLTTKKNDAVEGKHQSDKSKPCAGSGRTDT